MAGSLAPLPVDKTALVSWTFDASKYTGKALAVHSLALFELFDLVPALAARETVLNFVRRIGSLYNPQVPFHNFAHAVETQQAAAYFLLQTKAKAWMAQTDIFAILIAALGLDTAHPGLTNGFLVRTRHALAITYNDRSPLENMHCANLFHAAHDLFGKLAPEDTVWMRKMIIAAVLATDSAAHYRLLGEIAVLAEVKSSQQPGGIMPRTAAARAEAFGGSDDKARLLLGRTLVHAADVSGPARAFKQAERIARQLSDEFLLQGDHEKALGIPVSPFMDRRKRMPEVPKLQISLIEFIVAPLTAKVVEIFPELDRLRVRCE